MTEEQFAEMYAMGLFSQDETAKMWGSTPPPARRTWHTLTKKERNKYRSIADELIEEIK